MTKVLYPTAPSFGFPQGMVTRFEYDPRGQLTGVRDPSGRWDHAYDALGRLAETRGPGGVGQRRSYTPEGFLDRVDTALAGGGSEAIVYSQYDATGLPGRIVTSEGTTQLGYHARGWLASISYPDGTSEAFGYNAAGNRTTQTPRSGPPRFYGHDAADQLRFVFDADGFDTFDYDGAGRRIAKTPGTDTAAQTRYAYDALGRLTHVDMPDGCSPDLRYDALGRRVVRHELCSFPSFPDIHQLKESVYPSDWAERRNVEGRVRLVRGGGPDGVLAEINATVPGTRTAALLDDGLGNLAHADPLAGTAGTPGTRRYEAFGAVRSETGATLHVERGFAGLVPEGDTGLVYARARHYEPETGRFLQPEPMGLFQPNLYSYGANNPVVFSDPSGFAPQLNLSGPPDFLGFDSGDPFFDPLVSPTAIAASLQSSRGSFSSARVGEQMQDPFRGALPIAQAFEVAVVPGAGRVRGEFFIAKASALILQGDGRTFDASPNPFTSRAFFDLDFESGRGSFQINPSCFAGGFICQAPLPLGRGNEFSARQNGAAFEVSGSFTNSILPGPSIDFGISFFPSGSGVMFAGIRNAFPSFELTRTVEGTTSVLLNRAETSEFRLFDATGFDFFSGP